MIFPYRLSEFTKHLTTQDVEVVGRSPETISRSTKGKGSRK